MFAKIRELYYLIVPTYKTLETEVFLWADADKLLKENHKKPPEQQWHLSKKEDHNKIIGIVWLERRERIV